MSTHYSTSTSAGSQTLFGFVRAPVRAPLTCSQYPASMPFHSRGVLFGKVVPPQFFPTQAPPASDMNVTARHVFHRAVNSRPAENTGPITGPISGSMHVDRLKARAVGKSNYRPVDALHSTKSYDPSFQTSCLRRARNGGCTAPKKKGSIYNVHLTQPGVCHWGAIPRQTY